MSDDLPDRPPADDAGRDDQHSAARRTAQMLGVGLSLVFVSFLVVSRSVEAIAPARTTTAAQFEGATVALTDDDAGTSMFDARNMIPGDRRRSCIAVRYDGRHLPATVDLEVSTAGALAEYLDVRIRRGSGGRGATCEGFRAERELYSGGFVADELERLPAFRAERDGDEATFEIEVTLRPDAGEASGLTASAEFIWTTGP